jgi:hypothetical protein
LTAGPPLSLEEARRRLRDLGYLDGRVDRFLFRRAFEGRGGLFLPAILLTALALALASLAAVESSEPGFGSSFAALAALLAHLFAASLLPVAAAALLALFLADRSRAPSAAAAALGVFAALAVVALWVGGVWSLARHLPPRALLWGVPIAGAAFLAAGSVRAGFLARAYAHSRVLPARRRGKVVLAATALLTLAGAAALTVSKREPSAASPPRPAPREGAVVVVAVDGMSDSESVPGSSALAAALPGAVTGWWPARMASPPELWTDLATGEPSSRHGVAALERVRPRGSPLALRAPWGTAWYLKRLGPALHLVSSAPVSAEDRRRLTFWEVAASAGLPTLALGWWASGPWPGATVVGNEELLGPAHDGLEVDRRARELFRSRASGGERIRTLYLPGLDILRADPERRKVALAETLDFLREEAMRARERGDALIVLAADSHATDGSEFRAYVLDGAPPATLAIRPEDLAPSILARAGVPFARDLPGRPVPRLFGPNRLEVESVETYGPRIAPTGAEHRRSDRDYLEKLRSLGYLN